jgi:hypothetical protein
VAVQNLLSLVKSVTGDVRMPPEVILTVDVDAVNIL